jgi:hypothetical protein
MLYGAKLLQFAGFPTSEVLGPDASEEEIKALIERHGSVFVKPVFKGGVGKKGKAGLLGRAKDLKTALKEKERLYFVEHRRQPVRRPTARHSKARFPLSTGVFRSPTRIISAPT